MVGEHDVVLGRVRLVDAAEAGGGVGQGLGRADGVFLLQAVVDGDDGRVQGWN